MVEKYEQVISSDPASTVFVELAKALIERGDHARAIEVCQGGLSHHPTSVVGRVLWGKALINLGKPADAMNQFDLAVSIDKDNPHAYNLIGEVLLHKALYRSALPILRKAAALQPNDGRIRQWLEQTRAALAGGPAPVLTDATTVDMQSYDPSPRATVETARVLPSPDDPGATMLMDTGDNNLPTVVTQAYSPPTVAPAEETRSIRTPGPSSPRPSTATPARGVNTARASAPQGRPPDVAHPSAWEVPTQTNSHAVPAQAPFEAGRSSPTMELPSAPPPAPMLGDDDDPFAGVPKRTESSDVMRGLTSTFDALSDNDMPGISVPRQRPDAFDDLGDGPVITGDVIDEPARNEPSVVPSPELLGDQGGKAGLLGDVLSAQNEMPSAEAPLPPTSRNQPPARRGLLDDIPDDIEPSSQVEVQKVEVSTTTTEAIAREYERELREKLAVATSKKTFLQAHGLKLFIALGLVLAVGGGTGTFLWTRAHNQGLDLASAIGHGRTSLNADTSAQYQDGLKVLELAARMDSDNPEVSALTGYAHAMLYGEHGRQPADKQAAEAALNLLPVREGFPELVVVMQEQLADAATLKAAQQAVIASQIEKAEVHAEAGRLLLADGKTDEALKRLTKAVELFPGNVRALVTLGDYYLQSEDWENAIKMYGGDAAKLSPLHPGRVLGLAEARLQVGRELPDALSDVEKLTAETGLPPSLAGRRELVYGRLLSASGQHDEAIKVLAAAEPLNKNNPFALLMAQGSAYRAAGQMDLAQKSFEGAVKLAPKGEAEDAKEGLGRVLIARSREKELLAKIPREADARRVSLVRGIAYARLGEWKNARAELQKTQVSNKYPPEAVVYLSLADASEENADKAVEALKKLVDTTKRNKAVVQVALGRVYMQRGELDKAKSVLEEAAKDPTDYEANALMGELLVSLGLPEVASDFLVRAVERNGSHGPARHLLSRTMLDQGRYPDALKQAEAYVADNPAAAQAQKDLAFALYHSGRAREAEAPIGKALKLDADDAEAYRIKAQVLFSKGDAKNAFASLERANKINSKDAVTFCEIGNAMVRQGNLEIAPKAYEAARREDAKAACGDIGPFHARPQGNKNAVKELTEAGKKAIHSWDKALASASMARVKLLMNDVKGAKVAADEALAAGPFYAPAWYAVGAVALKQKDEARATEAMAKAAELDPSWGAARMANADMLLRQGPDLLPKAIAEYEAVLQVSQSDSDVNRAKNELKRLKKKL